MMMTNGDFIFGRKFEVGKFTQRRFITSRMVWAGWFKTEARFLSWLRVHKFSGGYVLIDLLRRSASV